MAGEIQIGGTTFATESGGTVTIVNVDSATNRQNLGLEIGVDVQAFDADTTKNDVANTFTANQIISVTDNTNAALSVTQLGTGNAFIVNDEGSETTPFVIDASGNVGIGLSSPSAKLDVNGELRATTTRAAGSGQDAAWFTGSGVVVTMSLGDLGAAGAGIFQYTRSSGSILVRSSTTGGVTLGSAGTSWASASDERQKDIIEPITNAVDKVKTLRTVIGKYKDDEENTRRSFLIAQDVQAVLPEAVDDTDPEQLGLRYTEVIPLLTAAIKEQQTIIESQQSQIDALTSRIEELETT